MAAFLDRKVIISASILLKKAWLGSKLGDSGPRNPFMWVLNNIDAGFKNPRWLTYTVIKEGVFLRNVSPSLGLSDHFPGCGILNYRSGRDWSVRVCYFWGALWHF